MEAPCNVEAAAPPPRAGALYGTTDDLLGAERRLKELPQAEVDAFWNEMGRRHQAAGVSETARAV